MDYGAMLRSRRKTLVLATFGLILGMAVIAGPLYYVWWRVKSVEHELALLSASHATELGALATAPATAAPPASDKAVLARDPDYRPLVFTAGPDGFATLDSTELGFPGPPRNIDLLGFQSYNPFVSQLHPLYARVDVDRLNERLNVNSNLTVKQHKELQVAPGYYYVRTNLGDLRTVILEPNLSPLERVYRLFYFYTSIAANGRSADDWIGSQAIRGVFYTDFRVGNFCTGHVNLFQSIFQKELPASRRIDLYGFARSGLEDVAKGHSVLEVNVGDKWIVLDPTMGFIPFDADGSTPLSFAEFLDARRTGKYVLKFMFQEPILGNDSLYATGIPDDGTVRHVVRENVDWNWSDIQVIQVGPDPSTLYMEEGTYDRMTPADWDKFGKKHPQDIFQDLSGEALKNRVKVTMKEDMYERPH